MKLTVKLDRRQNPREVIARMVNDLIHEEGYVVVFMGADSILLRKEEPGGGKKFVRFVVTGRTVEIVKRTGD